MKQPIERLTRSLKAAARAGSRIRQGVSRRTRTIQSRALEAADWLSIKEARLALSPYWAVRTISRYGR